MATQVTNNIVQAQAQLIANMNNALKSVGFYIEGEAKKKIRDNGSVDTGFLLNSVISEVDLQEKLVRVGSDKNYSVFVEKGTGIHAVDHNGRQTPWVYADPDTGKFIKTHGQEAKPFLAPAAEDNIDTIRNIIAAQMAVGMS